MPGKQRKPKPVAGAPLFLTPDEVCAALGINRVLLLELDKNGVLKPIRLGHTTVRYRASDLDALGKP